MSNLILYIDTTKPSIQNPVSSTTNTSTDASVLNFVGGDKFPLEFIFVANGSINGSLMTSSLSYQLGLGYLSSTTPLFSTSKFYIESASRVSCSLDLTSFTSSFTSTEQLNPYLQLAVSTPSGSINRRTYMLRKVTIYSPVDL
jgi:hypothetical protein